MASGTRNGLSDVAVAVLAVSAGGAVANNYALQPALATIAHGLHATSEAVSLALTGAMAGYLLGLVLLVPLVDRVRPSLLVPAQLAGLAAALGLAAASPRAAALFGCFVAVGAMTTVAAESAALVGKLAEPISRGARMGVIAGGVSAGILFSRLIGGALTGWLGWRAMLCCFALFCLAAAAAARGVLPTRAPIATSSYFHTLRSVPGLLVRHPALRRSCAAGMLWFLAFNLIWVGLSVRLAQPPYSLDAPAIGLYSLAGIPGLVLTRIAGRLADRCGTRRVIVAGLILAAVGAACLTAAPGNPAWTVTSLAAFDAGCFAAQVANQMIVVSLDQDRAGTLSSAYLVLYYASGAVGTATAALILATLGWQVLAALATLAVTGAAAAVLA
jgi:predicted MFS family arabinose efflux permease